MSNAEDSSQTVSEQIFTRMMSDLAGDDLFPESLLQEIWALIETDQLTDDKRILEALRSTPQDMRHEAVET